MKAALGGPIVQLLLVVAAIALAILVITMLTPPPPQPMLPSNPEIRTYENINATYITMVIKNPATQRVHIQRIELETDQGILTLAPTPSGSTQITVSVVLPGQSSPTSVTATYNITKLSGGNEIMWDGVIESGETVTLKITIQSTTDGAEYIFGDKDQYAVTIYTDTAVIHGTAVYKG